MENNETQKKHNEKLRTIKTHEQQIKTIQIIQKTLHDNKKQ
jgi:hypothetical protein